MRGRTAARTILIACAAPGCSLAATSTANINVSVTVAASCSIALTPLFSQPQTAARSTASVCAPPAPPLTIVAPRPIVFLARDSERGVSMMIIEF